MREMLFRKLILVSLVSFLFLASSFDAVLAQEDGGRAIPLSIYQVIKKQQAVEEKLKDIPEVERTAEKIKEISDSIDISLYNPAIVGELTEKDGKMVGTTGIEGNARGRVDKGVYKITVGKVQGSTAVPPKEIVVRAGMSDVYIGIVPEIREENLFDRLLKLFSPVKAQEPKPNEASPGLASADTKVPVTLQLYFDRNQNKTRDEGENLVRWAGVEFTLENTSQVLNYHLYDGWNFIAFPIVPRSAASAKELIRDAAFAGAHITTVAKWENERWLEYSQRGEVEFGDDFALLPGVAYFLNNHSETDWSIAGDKLSLDDFSLQLRSGWNGVGIPKEGLAGEKVLDQVAGEQIARWDFGLWSVLVKKGELFGFDFEIKPSEGYFIFLGSDIDWKLK